ncbi:radical SAM protein [Geomesophilobacter sediminis]|uniref:Radical SAM protein n=1 Tax=Geomesophilobacter sediminis TaxID=2798584 RepID=A0A8J7JN01_9BACT|nr:radical SAM protein [Geomesophilobacter sediminis]MBJ6726450.1 radical SAM protein [Geomesophilobacter sediminis]
MADSAETKRLADEISRTLLADLPDLPALAHRLRAGNVLTDGEARTLIYHATRELNASLFPPITKMELVLTEACNLDCTYCFGKQMRRPRNMPVDVALGAVDLLIAYSGNAPCLDITHFGGEPLLNLPTLIAATEYAEERAAETGQMVRFNITTNGILLNQRLVEYLARHRIQVLLSLDGTAASHDRYRRDGKGGGTYLRVLNALRLLKARQPWIGVKMTVMPANAPQLFDDVRELHAEGVNQFLIGHASGVTWNGAEIAAYDEQMRRLGAWYREGQRELRIAEFEEGDGPVPRFGCQAGRDSISISVTGEVSSCSKVLALDSRNLLGKLGDVRYGLTHLVNRAQLVGCVELESACESLGIAAEYVGGCLAGNYQETGSLFRPSLQDHAFSVAKRAAEPIQTELPPPRKEGPGPEARP